MSQQHQGQQEQQQQRRIQHPMINVKDAIQIVLQETAKIVLATSQRPTMVVDTACNPHSIIGSVLAHDIVMPEPGYPPYRASIMDGYALQQQQQSPVDVDECNQQATSFDDVSLTFRIVGHAHAGDKVAPPSTMQSTNDCGGELQLLQQRPLAAYYITTGAVVPESCHCVVPIEDCVVVDDLLHVKQSAIAAAVPSAWIRTVGSDIAAGEVVLAKGTMMDAYSLGLALQAGCSRIPVYKPITVGVLSTGNELLTDWTTQSRAGTIPDVNRPVLLALLKEFGNCNAIDLGMTRDDDYEGMATLIQSQLQQCDVIVTTGGVSMGETDQVHDALLHKGKGKLLFGRLNMKPGKPTTFVTMESEWGTRLVFALPGNPVSGIVCTHLLVRPCLDLLRAGLDKSTLCRQAPKQRQLEWIVENARVHCEIQATLSCDYKLDRGRPEYARVMTESLANGTFRVTPTGAQRSSRLMSMQHADGLLVLPKGTVEKPLAHKGELYTVLLLRDSSILPRTTFSNSMHLKKRHRSLQMQCVLIDADAPIDSDDLVKRARTALTSPRGCSFTVGPIRTFADATDSMFDFLKANTEADLHVVLCDKFKGEAFRKHLQVSNYLRSGLEKVSDTMALQARRGAAKRDPTAALFEVVIGYIPDLHGSLLIFLPLSGFDTALEDVRDLLEHALLIARGRVIVKKGM
jgi:molybdenum cofactor synthesis domain-containing protein